MDNNDFRDTYTYDRGTYYSVPRWNDFTFDDEKRAKRRFSRFFLGVFFYLLISQVAAIIISVALALFLGEEYLKLVETSWFALVFNTVVMYVIAFPVFYFIVMGMKKTIRVKKGLKFSELFKIFLVAEAFMTVGNFIGNYLNLFIGSFIGKMPTDSTAELVMNSNIWLIILVAVIIGPIVEELIFRKLLMDRLGIYGDRLAIFVSAIAFGIFHCNLYQFFYATLLGFVLAYMYSKTSNVWYPIGLHMIINFFGSVIPMLLMDKIVRFEELSALIMNTAPENISNDVMLELTQLSAIVGGYSLLQIGMTVAGLIIFFKQRRKIFVSDRCEVSIPKNRRGNVIFGNAGVICFLVITGILITFNLFVS